MSGKKTRCIECGEKGIYVFGAGQFASKFIDCYHNDYDILGVVDNSPLKQGSSWKSYTISTPEVLRENPDCMVIVCVKNSEPIVQQLHNMGVESIGVYDAHCVYPGRQADETIERKGKQYHIGFCYIPNIFMLNRIQTHLSGIKELCDYLIIGISECDGAEKNGVAEEFENRFGTEMLIDEVVYVSASYCTAADLLEKYHYDVFFSFDNQMESSYWTQMKQYTSQYGAEILSLPGSSVGHREAQPLLSACKHVRRLGIYTFFEKDGIVDEYVLCFLKSFRHVVERCIVVSNGELVGSGADDIRAIGCELLVRENKGFDAWGVRTGLLHVGFEMLAEYDEVLIANNTIFGPIYDMENMLNEMATRDLDFWGCSSHPGFPNFDPYGSNPYGYIPEHIQSYFYAVRKQMLSDPCFEVFWRELPPLPSYNKAVGLYETVMTKWFSDEGFVWGTYMPSDEYYDMTDNPLITMPVESIKKWKCPFFKRRAFFQDYDYYTTYTGQHTVSCLVQFLEEETSYPLRLVYENLIRTCNMSSLVQNMHLARILDKYSDYCKRPEPKAKTALFMHVYDTSMLPLLKSYTVNLPRSTDMFVSTTSEEKKQAILAALGGSNHLEIRVLPNIGRDVSALLVSFRDVVFNYDYICVTHDKKTAHLKPECIGEGFAYMGYENILASESYIKAVIEAFEEDPFLGLLYAPDPNHAAFASHIGLEWGNNFERTLALAQELGLKVPINREHPPMAPYGSSFWCRTEALKPLFRKHWQYSDFPDEPLKETDGTVLQAIERIYPYTAQEMGLYSALLMTTDYAAVEIDNLQFYTMQYTHACYDNGISGYYIAMRSQLNERLDRSSI